MYSEILTGLFVFLNAMYPKIIFNFILLLSVCFSSCSTQKSMAQRGKKEEKKPDWVVSRPVDHGYYQGVGVAMVNNYTQGHVEEAKKKALNDIISEISVNVKSSSVMQQIENNDELKSMYQSLTKVNSENSIEGYELVDSWGNDKEYWVYYRLSKELFHRNKMRRLDRAKNVASQYFESGKSGLKKGDIGRAYEDFVKGLTSLKEYLDEEITIVTDKGKEYLVDALLYELIELNRNMTINGPDQFLSVRLAAPVEKEIYITAEYKDRGIPIQLRPYFSVGAGEVPRSFKTNLKGEGSFYIQRVTGGENQQVLQISVDVEGMTAEADNDLIARLIRLKCPVPSHKVNIEADKINAYLNIVEDRFDKQEEVSGLSKTIKHRLSENAFEFRQSMNGAEVSVEISVTASKGESYELKKLVLYTAYIDLYIAITDLKNGSQLYYKGFSDVKGSRSGSYKLALEEAEEAALERFLKELLPEIANIDLD